MIFLPNSDHSYHSARIPPGSGWNVRGRVKYSVNPPPARICKRGVGWALSRSNKNNNNKMKKKTHLGPKRRQTRRLGPFCLRGPALAFVGRHWLPWAFVGLHWPALAAVGFRGGALAAFGLRWPALAFVGRRWLPWAFVGLRWPSLAAVGFHGPALACVGCCGPSLTCVGLRWPSLAVVGRWWWEVNRASGGGRIPEKLTNESS